MYPPSRHIAPRKPALEPPFHCSHFPAVIVQVQGRVGVILDSGEGNETTRFHHRPRRRERPCCGTTEKRDELSSLHDSVYQLAMAGDRLAGHQEHGGFDRKRALRLMVY